MKDNNLSTVKPLLNDNLFIQWEQELNQRRQLRNSEEGTGSLLPINTEEDVEALWRAWYFCGQKDTFWSLLVENMHLSPVLTWLVADEARLNEFLAFLTNFLRQNKLDFRKLQYLVNLYTDKFNDHFVSIAATLDTNACSFLASRSANPQWRKIINQRLHLIKEKRKAFFYDLDDQIINSALPSIQGDKISLLTNGIELLQTSMTENAERGIRLNTILEAVDIFFKAGMIDDSLALLIELYQEFSIELSEADLNKFSKLLRKIVSVYSLIHKREAANHFAISIYHDYFPQLELDNVTIKYLDLYVSLQFAGLSATNYALYQIAFAAEQITLFRPEEYVLLSNLDLNTGFTEERVTELTSLVEQKLVSLPHEAFITMQLLCFLINRQLADANFLANFLLSKALLLFQWVPSSLFINNSLVESLAPLANDESRNEARRITTEIELYNKSDNSTGLVHKLKLSKNKDAARLRQIAAGKYLGVL